MWVRLEDNGFTRRTHACEERLQQAQRPSPEEGGPQGQAVQPVRRGGLGLEVQPTGSKWWRLRYRFDGKEKMLSLGVYPDVGLKEARERRDKARQDVAQGNRTATSRQRLAALRQSTWTAANSAE